MLLGKAAAKTSLKKGRYRHLEKAVRVYFYKVQSDCVSCRGILPGC